MFFKKNLEKNSYICSKKYKMKKKSLKHFFIFLVFLIVLLLQKCGVDDSSGLQQDFVSGTVTYTDSNFYFNGFYYAVSVYGDSTNPFSHSPITSDSVQINLQSNPKTAYYKISGLANGNYYIASTWMTSNKTVYKILGSYGCDTVPNCSNLIKVTVPSYAGNGQLNFKSKTH